MWDACCSCAWECWPCAETKAGSTCWNHRWRSWFRLCKRGRRPSGTDLGTLHSMKIPSPLWSRIKPWWKVLIANNWDLQAAAAVILGDGAWLPDAPGGQYYGMIRGMIMDELGQSCILLHPVASCCSCLWIQTVLAFQRLIHNTFFFLFFWVRFVWLLLKTLDLTYISIPRKESDILANMYRLEHDAPKYQNIQIPTAYSLNAMCRHQNAHCTSTTITSSWAQRFCPAGSQCSLHVLVFNTCLTLTQALTWWRVCIATVLGTEHVHQFIV